MTEEKKSQEKIKVDNNAASEAVAKSVYGEKKAERSKKKKMVKGKREKRDDFEQKIVDLARVTRVMGGGKRMRFRACVAIGDKKGQVGIGLAKAADVTNAINKSANNARKSLITVPFVNDTIPHEIKLKLGAAVILLKPARKGKGVIAGGAARVILELAGVKNVTCKILGTNNKVNIVKSTIKALSSFKRVNKIEQKKENTVNIATEKKVSLGEVVKKEEVANKKSAVKKTVKKTTTKKEDKK